MKELPTNFKKWGANWTVLDRNENWCIVIQQWLQGGENYNVCKIKKANECLMPNGKTIPAQEMLPSAEEWGRIAWNFGKDIQAAERKFDELTK